MGNEGSTSNEKMSEQNSDGGISSNESGKSEQRSKGSSISKPDVGKKRSERNDAAKMGSMDALSGECSTNYYAGLQGV